MKSSRFLSIDLKDFRYLTGETAYTFPLEITGNWLNLNLSSDDSVSVYLADTQKGEFYPLGVTNSLRREYRLCGFDTLLVKSKKATQIAIRVETSTAIDRDPVDYQPVVIDEPVAQTERKMLEVMLEEKLRAMGVDYEPSGPDDDDPDELEFFDDEDMAPTAYQEIDEIFTAEPDLQLQGENDGENPQPEVNDLENEPENAKPSQDEPGTGA